MSSHMITFYLHRLVKQAGRAKKKITSPDLVEKETHRGRVSGPFRVPDGMGRMAQRRSATHLAGTQHYGLLLQIQGL